jgi:hypothetical protein
MTIEEPKNDIDAAWQGRLVKASALLETNLTRAEANTQRLAPTLEQQGVPCHPKVTRFPLHGVYRAILFAPRRPNEYRPQRQPTSAEAPGEPERDPPPLAS